MLVKAEDASGLRPQPRRRPGSASEDVPLSNKGKEGIMPVTQNRKMKMGECRRTKRGAKYCMTRKGVRFVKK